MNDDPAACRREMRGTRIYRIHFAHDGQAHPKKNQLKPHLKKCWCIPPEHNAAFVAAMEDVLEVYSRSYNDRYPVVCMDEKPLQLLAEVRRRIKMKPGMEERFDNEYIRKGTCSIFLFCEPLSGWRYADANERRTKIVTIY